MTTERFVSHNKFGVGRIVGDDAGYVHVLFIDIYEKKKFQKSCEQIVPVPHSLEDFQKLRARQLRWTPLSRQSRAVFIKFFQRLF